MLLEYQRPKAEDLIQHEVEIKRSRFICFIARTENEDQARTFINTIKAQYPNARHHCSAYILYQMNANPVERSSDDGEPSGTAGKPMLDVLKGSGLLDITAVVVRYFGGIKLGAGGLVHAYSGVVSETISHVSPVTRAQRQLFSTVVGHCEAGRIEAELRNRGFVITAIDYAAEVTFTIAVEPGDGEQLAATLALLTAGSAQPKQVGTNWIELP